MTENIQNRRMVHICTGCYGQALRNVPSDKGIEILMFPEFVQRALDTQL